MDLESRPSPPFELSPLVEDDALQPAATTVGKRRKPSSSELCSGIYLALLACSTALLLLAVFHGDQWSYEMKTNEDFSSSVDASRDAFVGGLLAPGHNETSCQSMYRSALYHKTSPHEPSPYLLHKLRNYEAYHRRCGPNTELFNRAMNDLDSTRRGSHQTYCRYIVCNPKDGLGNRMVAIISTFLYALLTDRVLLLDRGVDVGGLFCEPFLQTSWLLPLDSPIPCFGTFYRDSLRSFGILLKNNILNDSLSCVYIHLMHNYTDYDKRFFCDEDQALLERIPWLVLQSNQYFAPAFFRMPEFERQLGLFFPEKDTVFHHLSRYLFHPANPVWGLITRSYKSYLAMADHRVGMQIRVFDPEKTSLMRNGINSLQQILDQILQCSINEKLLPRIASEGATSALKYPSKKATAYVLLITSLRSEFAESIRNMYWEHPTTSGDWVAVYQPSNEGQQQTGKSLHDMKALAEIYLLSLTDVLVTSALSTFGYVAQAIGGVRPWIMAKPENGTVPEPPCGLAMSMEPCYHVPPSLDCKKKRGVDMETIAAYVRHCEDVPEGIKLVNLERLI